MPSPRRNRDPLDLGRAQRFLRGLARNNDRTWFHAHRTDWDAHVRHGFEDLVTLLLLDGASDDPRIAHVDPRACVFRLANDTRFHQQRPPYKTWLAAWLSPGGKDGAYAGYYVQLLPRGAHVSAGIYVPTKPALAGLRAALADERTARGFDAILRARALRGHLPLITDPLRVMPRGFSKDHPRAALLRARRFLVSRDVPQAELEKKGLFAVARETITACAPLVRWIDERAAFTAARATADEDGEWA